MEAGQPIEVMDRPHPEWPVRAVGRAMLERKADPERAARLARCLELAANWKVRLVANS